MKRWLSQVIVLLKVIITQNTEENLLSRITQLGLTGGLIGNIVDNDEQDVSDVMSETDPAKVRILTSEGDWITLFYMEVESPRFTGPSVPRDKSDKCLLRVCFPPPHTRTHQHVLTFWNESYSLLK